MSIESDISDGYISRCVFLINVELEVKAGGPIYKTARRVVI